MKLNELQVERMLTQVDARVLPAGHPADVELNQLFGDHTFFLDNSGVSILEAADTAEDGVETGEIISLADWTDTTCTQLRPHAPEPTGVLVALEYKH